jgi:hypothetical protein
LNLLTYCFFVYSEHQHQLSTTSSTLALRIITSCTYIPYLITWSWYLRCRHRPSVSTHVLAIGLDPGIETRMVHGLARVGVFASFTLANSIGAHRKPYLPCCRCTCGSSHTHTSDRRTMFLAYRPHRQLPPPNLGPCQVSRC